ncbi:MAG TPA: J domain-containing protein [Candidatus Dormibacteraeota bacterium]|nr:J domain-containing protein [Candidatus Dormibacteraeota bacterium]
MTPDTSVVAALEADGAPADVAKQINAEARGRVDRELAAAVRLPSSCMREINYYFLLGLTPEAAPDQIHRAYRRKANEVHPDHHRGEFVADQWEDLMTVVADASEVLTDPRKRRAYDVFWRQRSHSISIRYRTKGDKRGDVQTRYLWEIAEMAELEEALGSLLEELRRGLLAGEDKAPAAAALTRALEQYEGRMIEIRTQAQTFPGHLTWFADRVRAEMQRKERLVSALQQLVVEQFAMYALIDRVLEVLGEIRRAQHVFDLGTARPFI